MRHATTWLMPPPTGTTTRTDVTRGRKSALEVTPKPYGRNEDTVGDNYDTRRQCKNRATYPTCHCSSSWHKTPHHRPATKPKAPKQSDRLGEPKLGPKPRLRGAPHE